MDNIEERLRRAVRWRRPGRFDRTVKLGDSLGKFMNGRVTPQQARFSQVVEVWERLLPEAIRRHCEIVDISAGRLKVRVDSPSYRYELQLCSGELLDQLQQQCRVAKIRKIEFTVG